MNKEENKIFIINLLEFGKEQGLNGISWVQLADWAKDQRIISDYEEYSMRSPENSIIVNSNYEEWNFLRTWFLECFKESTSYSDEKRVLKSEYYFRLIDYYEFKEAKRSSKQANRNAKYALYVAITALILTIIFGILQTNKSTKVELKPTIQIETTTEGILVEDIWRTSINLTLSDNFANVSFFVDKNLLLSKLYNV